MTRHDFGDHDQRLCAAIELLRVTSSFLSAFGLSRAEIALALSNANEFEKAPQCLSGESRMDPLFSVGACLRLWHMSDRYTDQNGVPAALPKHGPVSFHSLAMECGHPDPEKTMDLAVQLDLVSFDGHRFRPTRRDARTPPNGPIPLEFGVQEVTRFLSTLIQNTLGRSPEKPSIFQRSAHEFSLSRKYTAVFNRFVAEQGEEFIQMVDDWMHQHRATSHEQDAVPVSVHAFAWIGDANPPELRRATIRKKRSKIPKRQKADA